MSGRKRRPKSLAVIVPTVLATLVCYARILRTLMISTAGRIGLKIFRERASAQNVTTFHVEMKLRDG